jgi:hypothetical protein
MSLSSYRARLLEALRAVSKDGRMIHIEVAVNVLIPVADEVVREIVQDVYRERNTDD